MTNLGLGLSRRFVFAVYTQIENHVLNPVVMSKTVRINPSRSRIRGHRDRADVRNGRAAGDQEAEEPLHCEQVHEQAVIGSDPGEQQ